MLILQRLAEKTFAILSLLGFTGALVPHVPDTSQLYPVLTQVLPYASQVVTIFLIVARSKRVVRIIIREKLLWALVGIALASVFWSYEPTLTLDSVSSLLRGTLFGVYLGTRYSLNEQLQLLTWTFGIAALLNLVVGLVFPKYGVMGSNSYYIDGDSMAHGGGWQGIYLHKNGMGIIMALSAIVFLLFATSSHRYRWIAWAGFGLSVGLILLSTSKTALVILLTIVTLLPLYRALRWNYTLAVPLFITVVLVGGGLATWYLNNAETILNTLGRDTTFSGRTDIWSAILNKIWERPWLGYGYGKVFWLGSGSESADVVRVIKFKIAHAHNGFLDLWLDLGLLGLSVFAISFLTVYLRAVTWVRLTKTAEGLWPLAYLTFMVLPNLSETFLIGSHIYWILYVAVTLSMHNRRSTWRNLMYSGNSK